MDKVSLRAKFLAYKLICFQDTDSKDGFVGLKHDGMLKNPYHCKKSVGDVEA